MARAIGEFNGLNIGGRAINVSEARLLEFRGGRSGGGVLKLSLSMAVWRTLKGTGIAWALRWRPELFTFPEHRSSKLRVHPKQQD
jgi:hypothetical protein